MTWTSNESATIIRTERGLTIGGTRITLYDVMDYQKSQYPPKLIGDILSLSDEQVAAALSYIEANLSEVEAEYQIVLEAAAEIRQYWEERNRERLTEIAKLPPPPGREEAWKKLQAQKSKLKVQHESSA
jgi:uncharacterized protein (DUF433 family)